MSLPQTAMKFLPVLLGLLAFDVASAQSIKLPTIADNSIVMVDGEWEENGGSNGRIRIKGNQHIVAMAFDMSAIRGKPVRKATLVCWQGEHTISGVTISTIATPWDETKSNGLTAGMADIVDWGYPGARFPSVTGGNGFTLVHQAASEIRDGRYYWDVSPDIVYAMAIGASQGIAIHEHDSDVGRNPTIYSREQNAKQPFLMVEIDEAVEPEILPKQPDDLAVSNATSESADLFLSPSDGCFAYEVFVDNRPLGRHNIPFASGSVLLRDLPESIRPNVPYQIKVQALNRLGQTSAPAEIRSVILRSKQLETASSVALEPHPPLAGLSVIPVVDKYDLSGQPVGELPDDYRSHNSIFDGQRVHLKAAAGEVVGFQVLLRSRNSSSTAPDNVSVEVLMDDADTRVDLYQAKYLPNRSSDGQVRMIPDPLLPLPTTLPLDRDQDQAVVADVFVPFEATAGIRKGSFRVSDGRVIPIELEVLPFSIPRKASFLCEMNSYGLPDHVDDFNELQRIAYDHRVHLNILHYSHNTAAAGARKSNLDMRLRSGKRMDNKRYDAIEPYAVKGYWDDFTEAFGPYIDGSLFKDGHRGPVPAPAFYLTFHESWPLNCRPYFNGNPDAFVAFYDSPAYERTYDNILRDFRQRAQDAGWTETKFQVYFNNKGSLNELNKAPWILDEPASYWDYRALRFFRLLTARSREVAPNVEIDFRIDISRPEFSRGQLESGQDLWVVSSWAFENYRRLVTDRVAFDGLEAWVYGTTSHVHESNRNTQAWALDAWQHGALGVVPWQTVNKSGSALREPDQLGLFIFDKDEQGKTVIRHSLRLKAYREVEQLIEYLEAVQQKHGWTSEEMRRFVLEYVDLNASIDKSNEADAGTSSYGGVSASDLDRLKRAAADLLAH